MMIDAGSLLGGGVALLGFFAGCIISVARLYNRLDRAEQRILSLDQQHSVTAQQVSSQDDRFEKIMIELAKLDTKLDIVARHKSFGAGLGHD